MPPRMAFTAQAAATPSGTPPMPINTSPPAPGVQAIGLLLPRAGRVQVSMNVLDVERSPLHEVVRRVGSEAEARGVAVAGGELVGLVPRSVLEAARAAGVEVPGISDSRTIEHALGSGF